MSKVCLALLLLAVVASGLDIKNDPYFTYIQDTVYWINRFRTNLTLLIDYAEEWTNLRTYAKDHSNWAQNSFMCWDDLDMLKQR